MTGSSSVWTIQVRMMQRAACENSHNRVVYMRADTLSLPFDDGVFDAVCCLAALHLLPEPMGVLREMVRVLAPLGRIAVLTSYRRESSLARKALALGATICRVQVFDRTTVPAFFAAAGVDRHRPATARDLPIRHGMQAGTGSRA